MSETRYDVVVVGAGKAGSQLAASLRDEGFAGSVLLIGDEVSPPYDRPPLSKGYLLGDTPREELLLRSLSFYESSGVDAEFGSPVDALDPGARTVTLRDGRVIEYGDLVLATGARVRPLPFPGATLTGVSGLRTLGDSDRLKDQLAAGGPVVVIGGGFIGLEVAIVAATRFGCQVTLVEALPQLMSRNGLPETAAHVKDYHESLGVRVLLGTQVAEIRGDEHGTVTSVVTGDGSVLPARSVIYGIGVDPRTELAVDADLEIANGILVDEFLQASVEHVYAIGDCAAFPSPFFGGIIRLESVQNATDQARQLASNLARKQRVPYTAVPWFWSDQADLKVQSAGITANRDLTVVVGKPHEGSFSVFAFQAGELIGADSVNAAADHLAVRRLLGMHSTEWKRKLTPEVAAAHDFSVKRFARDAMDTAAAS